jgi:hypothetical protein
MRRMVDLEFAAYNPQVRGFVVSFVQGVLMVCTTMEASGRSGHGVSPGRVRARFVRGLNAVVAYTLVACSACSPMPPAGNDNAAANVNQNSSPQPRCTTGSTGGVTTVSYNLDLVPIFANAGCLTSACHTGQFPQSGYNLESYEATFGPGDQASIFGLCDVVPGDPDASYLLEKLGANPRSGVRMPQGLTPLTAEQIELIRTWIAEGAQDN